MTHLDTCNCLFK